MQTNLQEVRSQVVQVIQDIGETAHHIPVIQVPYVPRQLLAHCFTFIYSHLQAESESKWAACVPLVDPFLAPT